MGPWEVSWHRGDTAAGTPAAAGSNGTLEHAFPDTQRLLTLLQALQSPAGAGAGDEAADVRAARALFRGGGGDIVVARAPGRLDVMGGIADYSGSLVLQMPLAEACHVAVQRRPAANGAPPRLRVVSLNARGVARAPELDMSLAELLPGGQPISYAAARELFGKDASRAWAAYVGGALLVLQREAAGARFPDSLDVLVASDVPEGKGVSSSAAVEVAAMSALAAAHGLAIDGRTLALLCQRVENQVVGAPCGVMDQMTAALGQQARLLALRCQPAEVEGSAAIPPHLAFWGVDSGRAHCVGGSDYRHVRVGAFMGLRIASQAAHEAAGGGGEGEAGGGEAAPLGGGYLANVPPSAWARWHEQRVPERMGGAAFLERYGSHWDAATAVDAAETYAVRQPAAHPVAEHSRVRAFRQILAAPPSREQLELLGELMRQSHASYSRCGLGSEGTDRLVDLVQEEQDAAAAAGQEPALFGAKITGGGCGGTVGILAVAGPAGEAAVARVVVRYAQESGTQPTVFQGSSAGAATFGHLRLRWRAAGG